MSNKEKTSLVPKLRFPEFLGTDSWGKKKLFDILNPAIREVAKPNSNYLAVGIRSHGKGTFHKPDQEPEKNSMDRLYLVHRDDLIVSITFAWEGAIAIAGDADHGAYVSHRFPTYEFKSSMSTPAFFRYVFSNSAFTYKLTLISPGGAGRNRVMNKKDFLEISVAIPSLLEQQKIADCLSSLDQLIAAQARKVDALKTYKNGLMQQLFPREGEIQPRLRFPEFRGGEAWSVGKLGNIAENLDNRRVPITSSDREIGDIPYYGASGIVDYVKDFIFDEDLLCVSEDGANLLARTYPIAFPISGKTWVNNHAHVLKFEHACTQKFIEIYLNSIKLDDFTTGMAQPKLNKAMLDSIPIPHPDIPEQQRIAGCITALDELVTAALQGLDDLKTHKQGLMQKLFPNLDSSES